MEVELTFKTKQIAENVDWELLLFDMLVSSTTAVASSVARSCTLRARNRFKCSLLCLLDAVLFSHCFLFPSFSGVLM